jgi:hypothetical protein
MVWWCGGVVCGVWCVVCGVWCGQCGVVLCLVAVGVTLAMDRGLGVGRGSGVVWCGVGARGSSISCSGCMQAHARWLHAVLVVCSVCSTVAVTQL